MKTPRKSWTAALAGGLFLFGASAWAATYYVSPDGTPQGDGTKEKPFASDFANAKLQPGDEVVFADGVYKSPLHIASIGNEKAPITYRAEHRQMAIIDGGRPITGWKKSSEAEGVWECPAKDDPASVMVDGDGLIKSNSSYRGDKKASLDEGMFNVEKTEGGVVLRIHPWANREPKEVLAINGSGLDVAGAFNVVDGLVVRHWLDGVHVGGQQVRVYQLDPESLYGELAGLAHNVYGSFNIVRNCIIRDMTGQGMTSNESRFNLIEDNVIYNAGNDQGSHGIYISQGAENLTLRRNVWWRTSGAGIQIYTGTGEDSPRGIVCEYNIIGPDKRNRCFPLANRKSTGFYVYGGHRWAGFNRIVHNIIIGPNDRAMSMNNSNFNLIADNTILGSDGAPLQLYQTFGNLFANNIIEYATGGGDIPAGYAIFPYGPEFARRSIFTNNLLLPKDGQGKELPSEMADSKIAAGDPFVSRATLDFRLKPDSEAREMGAALANLTSQAEGKSPDVGAFESASTAKFPEIPAWLLKEWPLSKRGQ